MLATSALGLSSLLIACSQVATPPAGTPAGTPASTSAPTDLPARGGTLRAGQIGDPVTNNGAPVGLGFNNRFLFYPVVEQLVRYRHSLEPELVLVETFDYNADHTRLTTRLKPDVTFHNGAPVTPEDVFFCVDIATNPEKYGAISILAPFAKRITSMKALDSRTMEFEFDQPRVNMTDVFAQLQITHAKSYEALRAGTDIQGTGPYRYVKWTPKQNIRLEANPNWHAKATEGGPYLDAIDVKIFADNDARGLAFESGELDLLLEAAPGLASRYKSTGQVYNAPKIGVWYLGILVDNPVLADPRTRQAIFYAMDRKRMIDELQEGVGGAITTQPWQSTSPAFDPALEGPFYDPDKARGLLKDAGFSQAKPLAIQTYQEGSQLAQLVQQNLNDIGIKTEIQQFDFGTLTQKFIDRSFTDLFVVTPMSYGDLIPLTTLQQAYPLRIPNLSHYETQAYDDIIANLQKLDPNSPEAKAQYVSLNKILREDPWVVPLQPFARIDLVGANVRGFGEYFITMSQSPNFGKVGLSKI
jgi:peptide/nickel transport system substrate-binding protein